MAWLPDSNALRRRARLIRLANLLSLGILLVVATSGSAPVEASAPKARCTLTFALAGDVMLGRGVAAALDGRWGEALSGVQPWLENADVAFVNLESPLTSRAPQAGAHDLRAPAQAAAALQSAGIDVVSLANNHALDAGPAGMGDTIGTLGAARIRVVLDPAVGASYGEPIVHLAQAPCLAYRVLAFDDSRAALDVDEACRRVRAAAAGGGPVIVSMHWGGEYQAGPSRRQRDLARALSRAGASVIVGHGPHVLQPVEWVGRTVVAYSLGNLLFDQPYPADCRWGAILQVTFERRAITALSVIPTVTRSGRTRAAVGDVAHAILARLDLGPAAAGDAALPSR